MVTMCICQKTNKSLFGQNVCSIYGMWRALTPSQVFCQIFETKIRRKTVLNPQMLPNCYDFFLKPIRNNYGVTTVHVFGQPWIMLVLHILEVIGNFFSKNPLVGAFSVVKVEICVIFLATEIFEILWNPF